MTLFSRTGLSNRLVVNEPLDTFTIPEGTVCRQLRIAYTKDAGTWILAKVTITDDAIRAVPPVNFRTETLDADQRRVRVSWDMPDGVTDSIWRTFTTVPAGGISASSPSGARPSPPCRQRPQPGSWTRRPLPPSGSRSGMPRTCARRPSRARFLSAGIRTHRAH